MKKLTLALTAAALTAPAAASAATVSVDPATGQDNTRVEQIRFVAAAGEANRLTIASVATVNLSQPPVVTFTDPGTTVTPGRGCVAGADAHTASCAFGANFGRLAVRAELGDGDDTLRTNGRGSFFGSFPIVALAGPGDDDVQGGGGNDELDGGGGTDRIDGGAGYDSISDGDTDADANADVLDGGGDFGAGYVDTISYAARSQPVRVDLNATTASNGATGEGDTLLRLGSVVAGAGDDDIRAREEGNSTYSNSFAGGAGDDRIQGSPLDDTILGGDGDDVLDGGGNGSGETQDDLDGGPGRDTLGSGPGNNRYHGGPGWDRFKCGRGAEDFVADAAPAELLPRGCETFSPAVAADGISFTWRAYGTITGRRTVRQRLSCPSAVRARCHGTVTLRRWDGRHQLLGRGRITPRTKDRVAIRLTKGGARLGHRLAGVAVTARVRGKRLPRITWSYRLKGTA